MQLKRGDALLIHGTFRRIFSDGNIGIDVKETNIHTDQPQDNLIYVSPTCVSIPSEPPTLVGSPSKHSPCRKFRKGDRVRVITWNGRTPFDTIHGLKINPGEVHIVLDDEYERNEVYIGMSAADEEQSVIHACHLELVTAVEELEPYSVVDAHTHWNVADKNMKTVAMYNKGYHPHAQAAAEAERDRLNAEHRKEQGND